MNKPPRDEMTRLAENLRELMAKATTLPWQSEARSDGDIGIYGAAPREISIGKVYSHAGEWDDDALLIVAAVNALPTLLHEIESLRAISQDTPSQQGLGEG